MPLDTRFLAPRTELFSLGAPPESSAPAAPSDHCGVGDWLGEQPAKSRVGLALVTAGAMTAGGAAGALASKKASTGAAVGAGAGLLVALVAGLGLFFSWRDSKAACNPPEPTEPTEP